MVSILNTRLVYLKQIRVSSQIIYSVFLLFILISIGLSPFLKVTISVNGTGLIQSTMEKTALIAPIDGRLIHLNLSDNQKIIKGETILIIDGTLPKEQSKLLSSHKIQLLGELKDANELIKAVDANLKTELNKLKTDLYAASWQQYAAQLGYANNSKQRAELVYQRHQKLYLKNVISLAELEQFEFNYKQALLEEQMIGKKYKSQWLIEANQYRNELRDIKSQKAQLNEQQKKCVVKATITGSVQNLIGLQSGAYVYANQRLGEVSPDSSLLALCYIKSSDIGLVRKGQSVRFRIDAYNYNQWGVLSGKVIDISDDVIVKNQDSYFKVKCQLDKGYLQLRSGYKGNVKKGMSFIASFTITKRSLFHLLFDKAHDWF